MLPLQGIKVVDLTHAAAGPFCSMLLADMGAEVVKIEPLSGELFRPLMKGAFIATLSRNKRGIALDLATKEGRPDSDAPRSSRILF